MYLDLKLATFEYIDGFGCDRFCLNRLDWNWWFSFELLRHFRFNFWTADHC